MHRITLTITFLCCSFVSLFGQLKFERDYSVEVNKNSGVLSRAWEGGLNYPIFSNVDFDNNNIDDLIAFDKSGKRVIIFKNNNLEFEPLNLNLSFERWVLFRDFNCDGFPDIFTGVSGGIRVYKNNGDFTFTSEIIQIQSDLGTFTSNLFVANEDIPGIADIDGDGDLDILTFEINGVYVEYHKNLSIEKTGKCGLDFKRSSQCWGRFEESASTNQIVLNKPCSAGDIDFRSGGKHAGSTITTFDHDYNGTTDIIIGDIAFNNLTFLNNGGNTSFSNISYKEDNFPSYDNPIDLFLFPYASYVDANSDGKKDILISSNNSNIGNNQNLLFYKNIGLNKDTFSFQTNNFLINEMLDFGTNAFPIWVDENQDGLTDILVGNNGINVDGIITAQLALLRNTGTASNPSFDLIDEDYLNFSENEESYVYPAIGDIDNDGDDDLLLGLKDGKILYMNNIAGAGLQYDFVLANAQLEGIDVGSYASPTLFDVNQDGNLDLVVGEQNGSLFYYENQSETDYDYSIETPNFGNISTQNFAEGIFLGYSTPFFFSYEGQVNLVVGGESGKTQFYEDIESEIYSDIALDQEDFQSTRDGGFSKPLVGDINNDNYPDLIIGNQCGGLAFHKGLNPNSIQKPIKQSKIKFKNTQKGVEFISSGVLAIQLFDLNGRLIKQSQSNFIETPNVGGVYFALVELKHEFVSVKILK